MASNFDDLSRKIKECENLYLKDHISDSFQLLQIIDNMAVSSNNDPKILQMISESAILQSVRKKGEALKKLEDLFVPVHSRWSLWNDGIGQHGDVSVHTNVDDRSGVYNCRVAGRVRADMISVIAALVEHDMHKTWLPLCSGCTDVRMESPNRASFNIEFDFVFVKKHCRLETYGDVLPDGAVLLQFKSLDDRTDGDSLHSLRLEGGILLRVAEPDQPVAQGTGLPLGYEDSFDIPLSYGIWDDVSKTRRSTTTALHSPMRLHVTSPPRNKEEVAAQIVFKMEPNFKFSTDWIFNMAIRSSISTILPMLEHQAKLFCSDRPQHTRITKTHSSFYQTVKERLNEVHQRLAKQPNLLQK